MNLHANIIQLGDVMASVGSTDPSKHPDETFVLYSIPAFDVGAPEFVQGRNIGSAKKNVRPNDVLLSRIVPHIRRSWIVGEHDERLLASGEWIVFRDARIFPAYLRHFLTSDLFHRQFMMTVAGVGGSLLRARPADVARIALRLPPLDEQRRIAAILDKADTLRQKRRRAIALLDSLTQSVFLEMFGDPKHNPLGFREVELGAVADFFAGNSLPAGEDYAAQANGYLLLKVSDMNLPGNEEMICYSAGWSSTAGSKASTCPTNAIVFPKRGGAISTNKKRRLSRPAILDPNVMGVYPKRGMLNEEYLFAWFQKLDLTEISSGSSVPQLNKQDLAPLMIAMPDMARQQDFAERLESIRPNRQAAGTALVASEALFTSLQHRAFSGQL